VRRLIPVDKSVLLFGDSEFRAVKIIHQVEAWKWWYVLRQKPRHQITLSSNSNWQCFGGVVKQPGQSIWLGPGLLTFEHAHLTNLFVHWKWEKEPWPLTANLLPGKRR
jgi:hypothetical protein